MNAVEIEEAVSDLVIQPFDKAEFPYRFLESFGNKETTLKRLRSGSSNRTDVEGAILQRSNIHILVTEEGKVDDGLKQLLSSEKTTQQKAKFVLVTDGKDVMAEDLNSSEPLHCSYEDLPKNFGFFLPLAGITTVAEIKNNAIDIKATGRLDKLYIELLKQNPEWAKKENRPAFNHFMAQLIFCFYAEDTSIFHKPGSGLVEDDVKSAGLFTDTVRTMSDSDGSNTDFIISEIFRAMNIDTRVKDLRANSNLKWWAGQFPYVNGGLFDGEVKVPKFSKIARTYLIRAGELDWTAINPDIFGSMIQAIADDDERGSLGMHYTSVPNIRKVLDPLFLDSLRDDLAKAGNNKQQLGKLKKRLSRIRVFDPACGSGNFLVIAYKQMREIEHQANLAAGWGAMESVILPTNFRGIEIKSFAAEVARLALIIAKYQADENYLGPKMAEMLFLPLSNRNWITCGNALRLDWLSICPPTGETVVKLHGDDLFNTPLDQSEIDFENEGGETYICGNPPYLGSTWQSKEQKEELKSIFDGRAKNWKSLDYVAGWFLKAADYLTHNDGTAAFVSTNSICQGQQVPILWPVVFATGNEIVFAHKSFKWANLASHNAGVTTVIVGLSQSYQGDKTLMEIAGDNEVRERIVTNINAYLVAGSNVIVFKSAKPLTDVYEMDFGSKPVDGGYLFLNFEDRFALLSTSPNARRFVHEYSNSSEFINGKKRYCLWIENQNLEAAKQIPEINSRLISIAVNRLKSTKKQTKELANTPHLFGENRRRPSDEIIVVPRVSSENREYLPVGLLPGDIVIGDRNFALYDAPLWNMALIASRLHWVWIGTVCVRMRTDFSYSNTLGWNTFPVPFLKAKDKERLTRAAENILLAREAHFPATIAELYKPDTMPENLRAAHAENDRILEEIYIGRRFKNDTERLEKLFEMYTNMTRKAP